MSLPDSWIRRKKAARSGGAPDPFRYDDVPPSLRVQILNILGRSIGIFRESNPWSSFQYFPPSNNLWIALEESLAHEFGLFALGGSQNAKRNFYDYFLASTDIDQVLVCIEWSFRIVDQAVRGWNAAARGESNVTQGADSAIAELNARLLEESVGYQWFSGQIIQIDNQFLHSELVVPALQLLSDPAFSGPNQEFLAAHDHFRAGRFKEAIAEANKSFESALKTICDRRGWSYKSTDAARALIAVVFANGLIPTYLQSQFNALQSVLESGAPTIRNREGGHGQGANPSEVPPHLASYAINLVAANIVLLVAADLAM